MTYLPNIDSCSSFKCWRLWVIMAFFLKLLFNVHIYKIPYVHGQRLGSLGGKLIYCPTLSLASTSALEYQANLMLALWYVADHNNMFVSALWRPTPPSRRSPRLLVERPRSITRPTCQVSEDSYSEVCLGNIKRRRARQHFHPGTRPAVSQHEWMIQSQPCQSYHPWHKSQKRGLACLGCQQTKAKNYWCRGGSWITVWCIQNVGAW